MNRGELDLRGLVYGMHALKSQGARNNAVRVIHAIDVLRKSTIPSAYIDGLQDELLALVCDRVPTDLKSHVYLTFHGERGVASHMKVGVAKNVRSRVGSFSTGNPLPELWTFAASFPGRHIAYRIERAILDHLGESRAKGEWVRVPMLGVIDAACMASELGGFASQHTTHPVNFKLAGQ